MSNAQPLFSDQERSILHKEGSRKGWDVSFRVDYTERDATFQIPGRLPAQEPEWSVTVRAMTPGARIEATILAGDPDGVRLLTRRFIEGLPDDSA